MVDHGAGEAERRAATAAARDRVSLAQKAPQIVEAAQEQLLLVGEVRVERGATDIRALTNVEHADLIPAALQNQLNERIAQTSAKLKEQQAKLLAAGVVIAPSNAEAARLAALVAFGSS